MSHLKNKKLVIGIADSCKADEVSMQHTYVDAVWRWGHVPMVLPAVEDRMQCHLLLDQVDMLLLAGGGDIAAERFGQANLPCSGVPNEKRDAYELMLVKEAITMKKPIFGICRGMQLINVALGGTLWQDVELKWQAEGAPSVKIEHQRPDCKWEGVHEINVNPFSKLVEILGTDRMRVNSTHHQVIKDVAEDLIVSALSDDGVIEGLESDDGLIVGVQFHPERLLDCFLKF